MLKRLAILAISASLQASAPVPGQTVKPAAQGGNQIQKQGDGNQSAPAPASSLVNKPVQSGAQHTNGDDVTGDDKKNTVTLTSLPPVTVAPITIVDKHKTFWDHMLDWGPWVFNLLLAVAAGFQVWLLLRTWKAIERQAGTMTDQANHMASQNLILASSVSAAQKSADAAEKSAHSAMGVSVPILVLHKLTLNLHPDGKLRSFFKYPEFRIEVKNFGQSPAFVKSYVIDIAAGDVPDEPVYSEPWRVDMQEVVDGGSTYLLGEGRCASPKSPDDAMFEAFAFGKKELIVYGYITYGDVFGSPIRTMKFCKIIAEIDFDGGHDPLMMDWGGPKYTGQSEEHKPN